jgi:hypothetical protein
LNVESEREKEMSIISKNRRDALLVETLLTFFSILKKIGIIYGEYTDGIPKGNTM